jgi:hypothetical protein
MRRWLIILSLLASLRANALDVRLLAPATDARLEGGATATIAWSASELPAHVEEWEAFLSVDGGAYYGIRITPHLDATLQRFAFTVPNITSNDARILLRFGDEEREEELELPLHFTIRATSAQSPRTLSTNEEGERGTALWVEGDRDGSHLEYVAHRMPVCTAPVVFATHAPPLDEAETSPEEDDVELDERPLRVLAARRVPHIAQPIEHGFDRLLQTRRLNI